MPVDTRHPRYEELLPKWKRCSDAFDGQDRVHAAGSEYLPRLTDQPEAEYQAYVKRALFFNATFRTVAGMVGMAFRVAPQVTVPDAVLPMLDDVTASGVPMHLFAQEATTEALKRGRLGVLVDYPRAPAGATLADARAQALRPTMQLYCAEEIINWRTAQVNNREALVLVVLAEKERVPEDEFKSRSEDRWRVLDLDGGAYRVRMFRKKARDGGGTEDEQIGPDVYPTMGGGTLDHIPFVFVGPDGVRPEPEDPPLIDLVDANLSHYRTTADLEHGAHFTGLPTPVVSGYKPEKPGDKLYIGSQAAWIFPDPSARAEFLEFKGEGLKALENLLDRKERMLAVLGARMLEQQKTKAVESADGQSIKRKGEESLLASTAKTVQLGLETALAWFCAWAGSPVEAGSDGLKYGLNTDFFPAPMTAPELTALVSAWQMGAISDQTLFQNLQRGEVISQDTTLEDEQARIQDSIQAQFSQPQGVNAPPPPPELAAAPAAKGGKAKQKPTAKGGGRDGG